MVHNNLPTLLQLIKQLQQVPYLASKNVYRVAHHFLEMDPQRLELFCTALKQAHEQLIKCPTCWIWQERSSSCIFCASPARNQSVICVVETWHDVFAIEKTGGFQGVYHVLGGAICPLDGIGPEDLTINPLIQRIATKGCTELILALNQTPEGEATAAFIARKLTQNNTSLINTEDKNLISERLASERLKITCLSRGIPVGSSIEAMDRITIFKALAERRPF